jgi:hypothetical protein
MFLHLGSDTVIPLREVITITDIKPSRQKINEDFLRQASGKKRIVDISEGTSKSFIVTNEVVYLSPISAATLKKRAQFLAESEEDNG